MASIIDGAALANQIREQVRAGVARFAAQGRAVHLTAILVGSTPAGELYAQRQKETCAAVGIDYELLTLPADATFDEVANTIERLNKDLSVTGIMLHLPLPAHLDATELQHRIDQVKDVEGVNPANIGYVVYGHTLIAPCTALAAVELIKSTGVTLRGAETVIVGASEIAGKPIALLLAEEMATVTLCHIATRDVAAHTRRADIVVVAVGKPNLITADHVREGAIVIDVGINRVPARDPAAAAAGKTRLCGDVLYEEAMGVAAAVTPVPGGVGPMTIACLLLNTLTAACRTTGVPVPEGVAPGH